MMPQGSKLNMQNKGKIVSSITINKYLYNKLTPIFYLSPYASIFS